MHVARGGRCDLRKQSLCSVWGHRPSRSIVHRFSNVCWYFLYQLPHGFQIGLICFPYISISLLTTFVQLFIALSRVLQLSPFSGGFTNHIGVTNISHGISCFIPSEVLPNQSASLTVSLITDFPRHTSFSQLCSFPIPYLLFHLKLFIYIYLSVSRFSPYYPNFPELLYLDLTAHYS